MAGCVILLAAACTATDSSTGPIATPQPPTTPAPTSTPSPTVEPTPAPRPPEVDQTGRPTIDELLAIPFPLNIAHAGGDQMAPHSTLFAMARAVEEGANMLELDVRLTADGALVVHHDETVDGTTDGSGLLRELTLAEAQALDNAYWFAPTCWPCRDLPEEEYVHRGVRTGDVDPPRFFTPEDFRIPTLREVVYRFPDMPLDIEIKGGYPEGFAVARALADEIEALSLTDSVVVVSFDDGVLTAFEIMAPEVETSPGVDELSLWFLGGKSLRDEHRIIQVPPEFDGVPVLTEEFWARARAEDLHVWIWMNDPRSQENLRFYQELIAQGADGIIAGRPNEMAAALL